MDRHLLKVLRGIRQPLQVLRGIRQPLRKILMGLEMLDTKVGMEMLDSEVGIERLDMKVVMGMAMLDMMLVLRNP